MIPSDKREILQENFDKKCKFEGSLEETIQYHQNTFNEWRYIYESKDFKADAYIDKLILATEVMINYADEIHCIRKCLPNDLMGIFSKS